MGVRFKTGTVVTGITCRDGRVAAVQTPAARCAAAWSSTRRAHTRITSPASRVSSSPFVPVRHEYYDTVPLPD